MKPEISATELPCGILLLDRKNHILSVNQLLCQWLGYTESQLLQQPLNLLLPVATKLIYLGHILPTLQTKGHVEEKYLLLKTAAATELPVLVNAERIEQDGENFFVFALMKMQFRHLIEAQLITERRRAEQATAEKDLLNTQLASAQAELVARHHELLELNAELAAQSTTDALTGLSNRRVYDKELHSRLALFDRGGPAFTLVLADIDFFKSINDTHGHETGDQVLKAVALSLLQNLRDTDLLARIGGEEFALILPAVDTQAAMMSAERHRDKIAGLDLAGIRVTTSFGIALVRAGDNEASLYKRADKALYQAKSNGRNCVSSADDGAI